MASSDVAVASDTEWASQLSALCLACPEMKESEPLWRRVHYWLSFAHGELAKAKSENLPQLGETSAAFTALLPRCLALMRCHSQRPLYARVTHNTTNKDELHSLNTEIQVILTALGVVTLADWGKQWDDDWIVVEKATEASISSGDITRLEIQDARAQLEAMTVLKYELAKVGSHSATSTHLMEKLFSEIKRVSAVEDVVVPAWFIAPEEVSYSPTPFPRGSFGSLHLGSWKPDQGTEVIVKTLCIEDPSALARQTLLNELDVWFQLDHPNLLKIVGACHLSSPPFVVYEDVSLVNLAAFLTASEDNKQHQWRLLYEAAQGLEYLHQNNVVHGHLMLTNILVGSDGRARLSDYGLAGLRASVTTQQGSGTSGRLRWRAPECLKRRAVAASDIYSLAMCVIAAATGEPPFAFVDDDTVYRLVRDGEIPGKPEHLDNEMWQLIEGMTRREPSDRTALTDVVAALRSRIVGSGDRLTCEEAQIPSLLQSLKEGGQEERSRAIVQLFRACDSCAACQAMVEADGIELVEDVARRKDETLATRLYAFGCLTRMRFNTASVTWDRAWETSRTIQGDHSAFAEMTRPLCESDEQISDVLEALEKGECIMWTTYDRPDKCIAEGSLSRIVELIGSGKTTLSTAACYAIGTLSVCHNLEWPSVTTATIVQRLEVLVECGNSKQQLAATYALGQIFGDHSKVRDTIELRASTTQTIVGLLHNGNDDVKIKLAGSVRLFCWSNTVLKQLEDAGAVETLVDLLRTGSEVQVCKALDALARMMLFSIRSEKLAAQANGSELIVTYLRSGSNAQRHRAAEALGSMAQTQHEAVEAAGGIPLLLAFVRDTSQDERVAGVEALKRLAASSTQSCVLINESDGVNILVTFLRESIRPNDKEMTIKAFCALSSHAPTYASMLKAGAIDVLAKFVQSSHSDLYKQRANQLLGRLVHHADQAGALPTELEWEHPHERPTNAHSDGSSGSPNSVQRVQGLVGELSWGDPSLTDARLRALDRSVRLRTSHEALVSCGGVDLLVEFVEGGSDDQKETAARILLCVASDDANAHAIKRADGISPLTKLLDSGSDSQKEIAAQTLLQLATDHEVCAKIVEAGAASAPITMAGVETPAADVASELLVAIAAACWIRSVDAHLVATLVVLSRRNASPLQLQAIAILHCLAETSSCSYVSLTSFLRAVGASLDDAESTTDKLAGIALVRRLANSPRARESFSESSVLEPLAVWATESPGKLSDAATAALADISETVSMHDALEFKSLARLAPTTSWARFALQQSLVTQPGEMRLEFACGLSLAVDSIGDTQISSFVKTRLDAAWASLLSDKDHAVATAMGDFVEALAIDALRVKLADDPFDAKEVLCCLTTYQRFHPLLLNADAVAAIATHASSSNNSSATAALASLAKSSEAARLAILGTNRIDSLIDVAFEWSDLETASAVASLALNDECLEIIKAHANGLEVIELVAWNGSLRERKDAKRVLRSLGVVLKLPVRKIEEPEQDNKSTQDDEVSNSTDGEHDDTGEGNCEDDGDDNGENDSDVSD